MEKNEKQYIIKSYQKNGNLNLQLFCCKCKGFNIVDKFILSQPFNRPDMYYLKNNICYIFEHFEVDASQFVEGRGSAYKRNCKIVDKELIEKSNEIIKNPKMKTNEISKHCSTMIRT